MDFHEIEVNQRAVAVSRWLEGHANRLVRGRDAVLGRLRLGGRKGPYDDHAYEFLGGPSDALRKRHYDKSLRLLWKAEQHAPWSSFRDCTPAEKQLLEMAEGALTREERVARERISSDEFRALLDREYTREQKQAIVHVLSAIGHGEAYAWMVSAEVLASVKSTGARAALTMQVVEEAKHFVVLRELLQAFDVPIPRQSAWEYLLLEGALKAEGLEKFFGMNVLVEGIALSLFGMMCNLPGLEILRLFHLDESRHTALPVNYFSEFPMSRREQRSLVRRVRRLNLVLPAVPLIFYLEGELAKLGIDSLELGGSILRKVAFLAQRVGFDLPIETETFVAVINHVLNVYKRVTRGDGEFRDYRYADTTLGANEREVEAAIFGTAAA